MGRFFSNKETPIVKNENEHAHLDNRQRILLGRTVAVAGIFVIAMMAIPNPLWGRLVFLLCGGAVFFVGVLLFSSTKDQAERYDISDDDFDGGSDVSVSTSKL